jgi:hypothetical protein
MNAVDLGMKRTGHVVKHIEIKGHFIHPGLGARMGLFILEDQGSYYNVVTALNYLPQP